MRDILVVGIVLLAALVALRRPWIGVMLWTWLSIMNPHRYTYGFAYDAPLAAIAAASTLVGLLLTTDRRNPFKGPPVALFVLFTVWITVSWGLGISPSGDHPQWDKVMKINLMIFVALVLLYTKKHVMALVWVAAGSLAVLGAKGGLFTVLNGGNYRVWGPEGSYIEDNNEFALALVITIPLLRFLQMQMTKVSARHTMTVVMLLLAASVLGSHSRGGLLAISAMVFFLWWHGKSRGMGGILIAVAAFAMISFMPDEWSGRMATINDYEEDGSAQGRLHAWHVAWEVAKHYFFGAGMSYQHQFLFDLYGETSKNVIAAHSIYFQVLGNHGFVGLFIYLAMWIATYRQASWLRSNAAAIPQARWAADLGAMVQVGLVGFLVGGAFLSLAYFDLPYNMLIMVVVTKNWVQTRAWERESDTPLFARPWFRRKKAPALSPYTAQRKPPDGA